MKQAFEKADGQNVLYVELSSGNHYAINDWNPVSAPHQVKRLFLSRQTPYKICTAALWTGALLIVLCSIH